MLILIQCEVCLYTSARKSDVTLHMRTHTGERPYKCPHCDLQCTQASNVTAHIRRKHADTIIPLEQPLEQAVDHDIEQAVGHDDMERAGSGGVE